MYALSMLTALTPARPRRRSGRPPSRASPGWSRPRPTARAGAGRRRRPRRACAAAATGSCTTSSVASASRARVTAARSPSTSGSSSGPVICSRSVSPDSSTQRPSVAMPIGTTSYLSRSMACSTLPAVTQEIACSLDRPPKTTATRLAAGLVGWDWLIGPDPSGLGWGAWPTTPRARAVPRDGRGARRPAAARAGPAAEPADHDGLDVRRRRRPGVRPLRQPDLDRRSRRRSASSRAAAAWPSPPGWPRWPPSSTSSGRTGCVVAPRHAYLGVRDAAGRPGVARPAEGRRSSTSPTPTRWSPPARTPRCCGSSRRPTRPSRSPTSRRSPRRRTRPARRWWSTTPSPRPLLQRPLDLGADIVVHSATKFLGRPQRRRAGRRRHPRRRGVRRPQGAARPDRRHPRDARVVAGAPRAAHPAPADRARAGQRRRAGRAGWPTTPRSARCATPASAPSWPIVLADGAIAADLLDPPDPAVGARHLASAAWSRRSSAGGAGRPRPPTIPEGLVRMSVGIEDVDDLWADLVAGARRTALTRQTGSSSRDPSGRCSTAPEFRTVRRSFAQPRAAVSRSRPWCRGR